MQEIKRKPTQQTKNQTKTKLKPLAQCQRTTWSEGLQILVCALSPAGPVQLGCRGRGGGLSLLDVQSFCVGWGGGIRKGHSLVAKLSCHQWYRRLICLFLRWSQNLHPLVHIFPNSHFYLFHLFPPCLCFPFLFSVLPHHFFFFSFFFGLPDGDPPSAKSYFDRLVAAGFLSCGCALQLALHTFSLQSSPAKKNMDFSKLFSTRTDQTKSRRSTMWKGRTRAKQETWQTWPKESRIRLSNICSELPKGQQSRGTNTQHTSLIAFPGESSLNPLKGTLGATSCNPTKAHNKSLAGWPAWRSEECVGMTALGTSAWKRN